MPVTQRWLTNFALKAFTFVKKQAGFNGESLLLAVFGIAVLTTSSATKLLLEKPSKKKIPIFM